MRNQILIKENILARLKLNIRLGIVNIVNRHVLRNINIVGNDTGRILYNRRSIGRRNRMERKRINFWV